MNLPKFSSTVLLTLFLSLTNFSFGGLSVHFFLSPVQGQTIEEKQAEADQLLEQSNQLYQNGQFQEAILLRQQALNIYKVIGNHPMQGRVLGLLGSAYLVLENYDEALDYYKQSLAVAQELDIAAPQGEILLYIGYIYRIKGEYTKAINALQQGLVIAQQLNHQDTEGQILDLLGNNYLLLRNYDKALNYYQQSLANAQELDLIAAQGGILFHIGEIYTIKGDYNRGINSLQQSLVIAQKINNYQLRGDILDLLGNTYSAIKNYDEALNYYQQSLAIAQELDDISHQGRLLISIGDIYIIKDDYTQAIVSFQQSLAIAKQVDDIEIEKSAQQGLLATQQRAKVKQLFEQGFEQYSNSLFQESIKSWEEALSIFRELGDRHNEALILMNLGNAYSGMRHYAQAIQIYQEALLIAQEINDQKHEGALFLNLAVSYTEIGKYEQAIAHIEKSVSIAQEINDRNILMRSFLNLGDILTTLKHNNRAIQVLNNSLKIAQENGDKDIERMTLNNLGIAYTKQGNYTQGINYYKQALAIAQRNNHLSGEVSILCNLGSAYSSLGDYTQAINFSRQSLAKSKKTGAQKCTSRSLNNLGMSLFKLGKLTEAEETLRQAVEYFEETRSFLGDNDDFKISIFEQQAATYRNIQEVLIAQNKTNEALEISERGRARAFVELLAKRLANQDNSFPTTITPPNIEQIKQIAQQQNATLVEYSLIGDNFSIEGKQQTKEAELYIWIVKPTGEITFRRSNLKPLWQQENTSLAKLVTHTRIALGVQGLPLRSLNRDEVAIKPRPGFEPYKDGLNRLHNLLIDPIADLLPTDPKEKVIFIPQSSLFLTPFPALQDENGTYLIEKHTILTAPSIQTLQLTREQKQKTTATGDALVVGNPTMPKVKDDPLEPAIQLASLPGAEKEAKAIAPLLNTQPFTGNEATKSTIVKQMTNANLIHLATHGLLDDVQGMGSAIALAPDSSPGNGLLTATEIYEMNLQAQLVVLSACNTGRGKITGDGVIGLSRSFISAGVPSVLVSLWAVPDAPTGELMVEFYNQLEKNPDKAQALRQAMLVTMKQHPEPKNWAAFTLIGEAD